VNVHIYQCAQVFFVIHGYVISHISMLYLVSDQVNISPLFLESLVVNQFHPQLKDKFIGGDKGEESDEVEEENHDNEI